MSQDNELTERQLLKEILKWIKFAGLKEVKKVLVSELDTDQKIQVYNLSDGNKSNAEINKATGVSTGAISGYWKKWTKQGLGEKKAVQGGDRFIKAFDLADFDIEVPEVKTGDAEVKAKEASRGN
jgi:hypothetical protein